MIWVVNLFAGQVFSFMYVHLHFFYDDGSSNLNEEFVWKVVFLLLLASLLSFGGFLSCMEKRYLKTFFSVETGSQFVCNLFHNAKKDEEKFDVFGNHSSFFMSIGSEIKEWLKDNWGKWMEEKPEWFNERAIDMIPTVLLPEIYLCTLEGGGAKRRRSSISIRDVVRRRVSLRG